jgi:hypothetical protein
MYHTYSMNIEISLKTTQLTNMYTKYKYCTPQMHVFFSNLTRFKKIMIPSNQPCLSDSSITKVPATTMMFANQNSLLMLPVKKLKYWSKILKRSS